MGTVEVIGVRKNGSQFAEKTPARRTVGWTIDTGTDGRVRGLATVCMHFGN